MATGTFRTVRLISAPPLTIYVILSKLLTCLSFLICKIGTIILPHRVVGEIKYRLIYTYACMYTYM